MTSMLPKPLDKTNNCVFLVIIGAISVNMRSNCGVFVNKIIKSNSPVTSFGVTTGTKYFLGGKSSCTTVKPFVLIAAICAGQPSIPVTSCPAFCSFTPNREPSAPNPAIAIFMLNYTAYAIAYASSISFRSTSSQLIH